MDESHAWPGPPARPVQGRRAAANTGPAPARLWAHRQEPRRCLAGTVALSRGWLPRRYPQTRRCGVNGPPTAAHSSVTTPTGSRGRPSTAPGPAHLRFRGPAGGTLLIKREGLNDAALVRQPHAGHLLRIDPRRRRAVLPALSRAAGGHRPMNLRPAGSWSSAPTISLPHCSWPFRAARRAASSPGQASHSSDPEDARDISRGRLWRERHARWGQVT